MINVGTNLNPTITVLARRFRRCPRVRIFLRHGSGDHLSAMRFVTGHSIVGTTLVKKPAILRMRKSPIAHSPLNWSPIVLAARLLLMKSWRTREPLARNQSPTARKHARSHYPAASTNVPGAAILVHVGHVCRLWTSNVDAAGRNHRQSATRAPSLPRSVGGSAGRSSTAADTSMESIAVPLRRKLSSVSPRNVKPKSPLLLMRSSRPSTYAPVPAGGI